MITFREFRDYTVVVSSAIGVHVLMMALIVVGTMDWQPFRKPRPTAIAIEAVIVDTSEIKKQLDEAHRAQLLEERRQNREEQLRQQRERERLDAEEAARLQRELEAQRKRDAENRLMQLRKAREQKQEEERLKQQRELEELRKQREEAERQRKLQAERLKQLENQRERERQQDLVREEEIQRQAAEQRQAREFRAGQMATDRERYVATIAAVVTDNWLRPPTAKAGLRCTVRVVQIPGGEIISSALVGRCNGDEVTQRSILAAVERTGALPYRGFEDVFSREIEFIFTYSGD